MHAACARTVGDSLALPHTGRPRPIQPSGTTVTAVPPEGERRAQGSACIVALRHGHVGAGLMRGPGCCWHRGGGGSVLCTGHARVGIIRRRTNSLWRHRILMMHAFEECTECKPPFLSLETQTPNPGLVSSRVRLLHSARMPSHGSAAVSPPPVDCRVMACVMEICAGGRSPRHALTVDT